MLYPDFWPILFETAEKGEITWEVLVIVGYVAVRGRAQLTKRSVMELLRTGDHQALRFLKDAVRSKWIREDPERPGEFHILEAWCQSAPARNRAESQAGHPVVPIGTREAPEEPEGSEKCPTLPLPWCQSAPAKDEKGSESQPEAVPIGTSVSCGAPSTRAIREEARRVRAKCEAEGKTPPQDAVKGQENIPEETFAPEFEANCKKARP